jgi:integrase
MPAKKLFEIGGHWVARVEGRSSLYRFWYDARAGEIRRRSLETTDVEEAKRLVAEHALNTVSLPAQEPLDALLLAVLNHYFTSHSDNLSSAHVARRAGILVLQFLETECGFGAEVKVGEFTKGLQSRFAVWSSNKFDHSPSYISRVLSVIAAACKFATKSTVHETTGGRIVETWLLKSMPEICYDIKWISGLTKKPEPHPRDYVPTFEDLASLLDVECSEVLKRYDIIALNTWARPQAILDLDTRTQVDFEAQLLHLNQPGRKQTNKKRPKIRLTENLRHWLEHWGEARPLTYAKTIIHDDQKVVVRPSATNIKAQFKRRTIRWMLLRDGLDRSAIDKLFSSARKRKTELLNKAIAKAEAHGIRRITPYTLRHFMATRVRGLKEVSVDREQRSLWLGHGKKDATSWYESLDPEFLLEASQATCIIIEKLDALTKRNLVATSLKKPRKLAGLKSKSA